MRNIYAITTHHEDPKRAAEAWKKCGVCAIGHWDTGTRRLADVPQTRLSKYGRLFLEIGKGDIVLAYTTDNTVAYVGAVIDGKYRYNDKNEVGQSRRFGYGHQLEIDWWDEPHHFSRKSLPSLLADQLGKRGVWVTPLDLGDFGFDKAANLLRNWPLSGSATAQPQEDMVKKGLRSYIVPHLDFLGEPGLRITAAEETDAAGNRPDFVGIDSSSRRVLIECKGSATESACDQLVRYGERHPKRKRRLLLVAFSFDPGCRAQAKRLGIELVKCELKFARL